MKRKRKSYSVYDWDYERTTPIRTDEGLKARSRRGAFARSWWANQWIEALEKLVDAGRLSRGRSYARQGQVLSIEETEKGIEARVQGSQRKPYKVAIHIAELSHDQWEKVIAALAEQAVFTAQLLNGEMPQDIDKAFDAAGESLFPRRRSDLVTHCSCPDPANPCKHIAATHYLLGERFDEDPFLLFRLRGRTQEQILQALRLRRAGMDGDLGEDEDEEPPVLPLEETIGYFWEMAAPLDGFSISIRPPVVEMPLLRRLGEPSAVPDPGLQSMLGPAYSQISRFALEAGHMAPDGEED